MRTLRHIAAMLMVSWAVVLSAANLPTALMRQLPSGYSVLASSRMEFGHPARTFYLVALGRKGEQRNLGGPRSPTRPLLIFEQRRAGLLTLSGRNDHVILRADEGGQCDPFLDGSGRIAVKGRYFTVENGVACGNHWTDYVTFRFDERQQSFVFANQRSEAWILNPSNDPDGEALVRDGPPRIRRPRAGQTITFDHWRPAR